MTSDGPIAVWLAGYVLCVYSMCHIWVPCKGILSSAPAYLMYTRKSTWTGNLKKCRSPEILKILTLFEVCKISRTGCEKRCHFPCPSASTQIRTMHGKRRHFARPLRVLQSGISPILKQLPDSWESQVLLSIFRFAKFHFKVLLLGEKFRNGSAQCQTATVEVVCKPPTLWVYLKVEFQKFEKVPEYRHPRESDTFSDVRNSTVHNPYRQYKCYHLFRPIQICTATDGRMSRRFAGPLIVRKRGILQILK